MKVFTKDRVDIQAWQRIPEKMAELGLTAEDGMTSAWFVSAENHLSAGAEAINRTLRTVWWLAPITYLYHIPGIKQLQNRTYQWIADNRYKLPGSTEACAIPTQKPASK